jgi:predicted MFS family arabinose efflux permease
MGVGLAESGASPPTMSMISDIFPPEKRARALSLFVLGTPIGMGLSFAIAGFVAPTWGWRAALLVAGVPGVFLALLMLFTLRHPVRGGMERQGAKAVKPASLKALAACLVEGHALKRVFLGTFLIVIGMAGLGAWMTSFLIREQGMSLKDAGFVMSLANGLGAFIGLALAVPFVEWLGRKRPRNLMIYAGITVIVAAAAALIVLFAQGTPAVTAGVVLYGTVHLLYSGLAYASVLNLTPAFIRGTMIGCEQVCANFIGGGLGPWSAGVLSDLIGGAHSLRWALTIEVTFVLLAAVLYLLAAKDYEADLEKVQSSD